MSPRLKRVLSIQSHVVSGYVGNKAAVFPLQLLGFDVDVINSVHFSNHTGHPQGFKGDVLNGDQLRTILDGLDNNGLLDNVGHLLTGYIGSESFLQAVLDVLQKLREKDRNTATANGGRRRVRYVCDPVMGDHGQFYVPLELVAAYRDHVIPQADVVTPNQFEVEQITGITIQTQEDALRACRALHDMGPSLVFITSTILQQQEEGQEQEQSITNHGNKNNGEAPSLISIIASQRKQRNNNSKSGENDTDDEIWRIDTEHIPGHYTGTGDLCAALLLGHTAGATTDASDDNDDDGGDGDKDTPVDLSVAMEKVTNTMFSVISRTSQSSGTTVASRELKLIQSKDDIENPPQVYKAYRISSSLSSSSSTTP